jgi:rsbT antagonist protein RsbS
MQPAVAITLVELGLSLKGVRTALDTEKGIALLQASLEQKEGLHDRADAGNDGNY